jgi:FKBP-type peptidyl-prolyl cis-trans isomerase SlyD
MIITLPCVVSLVWRLEDTQGQLIDKLSTSVEFLVGGDDLLPKVEEALLGKEQGFQTTLHLEPEHAFGDYDAELVFFEERHLFPEQTEVGMQFEGPPQGAKTPNMPTDALYTVTDVFPTHVVLDGNHPLAGIALRLNLSVENVREATEEEKQAQTVNASTDLSLQRMVPSRTKFH